MALLVGIVLTLISIILCVRQITKNKGMRTAANVAYDTRDERLRERDNLPPPLPPRNRRVCPEYATIADPDGAMPSNKDEPLANNMKENVAYNVVQNKWSIDTSSYSGCATIDRATSSLGGHPATEVNDDNSVHENEVDCENRSNEVDVKVSIADSSERNEESCNYVIVNDGITIRRLLL